MSEPWWRSGVLYQVYPRSFADSNGDGIGDLQGIIDHLDHLEWLGVDGIWISPVTSSPNVDFGYDVSDYRAVHRDYGTMEDFDRLVARARQKGIRVLMDFVPNHTSEDHDWFSESRAGALSAKRNWYVWADPGPDGGPPNNWVSTCGGPAWTLDAGSGQYYLHNHLPEQPDLNWWDEGVREEFDSTVRFWFDRGVAGLRIDVCNIIVKDALLRDNPPATEEDDLEVQLFGQRPVYNANRPEVHDVLRRWRRVADSYVEPRVLIGETPVALEEMAGYYGEGEDELHLAFNFPFITSAFEARSLSDVVEQTEKLLPSGAWPVWTGSNHDMGRLASRWANGDTRKARAALVILLCLRGTAVLYQGDEIGLVDTEVPRDRLRDPLGVRYWPAYAGRDAMRTPMHWSGAANGGFTRADADPWLPLGNFSACNVEDQIADPGSMLNLVRDLISLRRANDDLRIGRYEAIDVPRGAWAWRRGGRVLVAVNLSGDDSELEGLRGSIAISTDRSRDGEQLCGALKLAPFEGVVALS